MSATLEETGGARMHATVSGCGDNLAHDDEDAIDQARAYLTYLPSRWTEDPPVYEAHPPSRELHAGIVPEEETAGYDMHDVLDGLLDAGWRRGGFDPAFVGSTIRVNGAESRLSGRGNGLMSSVIAALHEAGGPDLDIVDESGSHHLTPKESVIPMDGGKSYKKFLTYGLQWTDKNYVWYVEGRQVHKLARPIPSAPMYLEFVQSLPEGGLLKDFMNPKLGPEPLQIDWVKVFKIP